MVCNKERVLLLNMYLGTLKKLKNAQRKVEESRTKHGYECKRSVLRVRYLRPSGRFAWAICVSLGRSILIRITLGIGLSFFSITLH